MTRASIDSRRAYALLFGRLYGDDDEDVERLMIEVSGSDHDLCYAVDSEHRRHLLVPIAGDYAFKSRHGAVLSLVEWYAQDQRYMDLVCASDRHSVVFSALADDLVERTNSSELEPAAEAQTVLDEWAQLFKPARVVPEEQKRGIFGELVVLGELARRNVHYALESWVGPDRAIHDFSTRRGDMEVKASARDGMSVTVSELNQLDPVGEDKRLILVRVRVTEGSDGQTLREKVDELIEIGLDRSQLVKKVLDEGFAYGVDQDDARYQVKDPAVAWTVEEDFPGLRSSDIPERRRESITSVSYDLDLLGAESFRVPDLSAVLDEMMSR